MPGSQNNHIYIEYAIAFKLYLVSKSASRLGDFVSLYSYSLLPAAWLRADLSGVLFFPSCSSL